MENRIDCFTDDEDFELFDHINECGWGYPIAFQEKRHIEEITGTETEAQTWQIKERVITFYDSLACHWSHPAS